MCIRDRYHERVRGEGTFARLEEHIRRSGQKHICVNMVVNTLNHESLDQAMEYVKQSPYIEQNSINFHTPYPGTEYLALPPEQKAAIIDRVLEYKRKGYGITLLNYALETARAVSASVTARNNAANAASAWQARWRRSSISPPTLCFRASN